MGDGGQTNRSGSRPHEKLEVYRIAHALALRVHALTLKLPKHEMYEEGSQSRRSSKSVSSQVVEGHALRQYKAESFITLAVLTQAPKRRSSTSITFWKLVPQVVSKRNVTNSSLNMQSFAGSCSITRVP
jgi:hypothetical protein